MSKNKSSGTRQGQGEKELEAMYSALDPNDSKYQGEKNNQKSGEKTKKAVENKRRPLRNSNLSDGVDCRSRQPESSHGRLADQRKETCFCYNFLFGKPEENR